MHCFDGVDNCCVCRNAHSCWIKGAMHVLATFVLANYSPTIIVSGHVSLLRIWLFT